MGEGGLGATGEKTHTGIYVLAPPPPATLCAGNQHVAEDIISNIQVLLQSLKRKYWMFIAKRKGKEC